MSNTVNTTLVSYPKAKKKTNIPRALREQVWITNVGNKFEAKCLVVWCQNTMNVFDYHVGHNIPESRGGATNITNLKPICARCNLSMSNYYSIEEWSRHCNNKYQAITAQATHTRDRLHLALNSYALFIQQFQVALVMNLVG